MRRALALAALSAALGACSGPRTSVAPSLPPAPIELNDAVREAALARGASFDPVDDATEFRAGDRVWFGLRHLDGDDETSYLVDIAVLAVDDELVTYETAVIDIGSGREARSTSEVPREHLYGFHEACDLARRGLGDGERTQAEIDEAVEVMTRGVLSLVGLLQIAMNNDALRDVLWTVVERPSMFEMVRALSGSISLNIAADFDRSRERTIALAGWSGPTDGNRVPVTLYLNDRRALEVELDVLRARPPLHTCAGIASFDAWHPTESNRRATMRILGAARGPEPDAAP